MADSTSYASVKTGAQITRSFERHHSTRSAKLDSTYGSETPTAFVGGESNGVVPDRSAEHVRQRTLSEDRSSVHRVVPITAPKVTVIQRSNAGPLFSLARSEIAFGSSAMSRALPSVPQQEVSAVLQTVQSAEMARDKEKKNLQDLNERLATIDTLK